MKCPRCSNNMIAEGVPEVFGREIWQTFVCVSCGFTAKQKSERPSL